MTPVVWRTYLGAGALMAGVALVLPVAPRSVLLIAVSASAALAIVVGIARHRPAARAARLDQAQAALSGEVQGLRQLMVSLRPPALDEVGLEAALRDQLGAFARRSGVDCSLRVALDGRLDGELETVVYRVTQEALHNVARHAQAGRRLPDRA